MDGSKNEDYPANMTSPQPPQRLPPPPPGIQAPSVANPIAQKKQRPGPWYGFGSLLLLIGLALAVVSAIGTDFVLPMIIPTEVEAGETIEVEANGYNIGGYSEELRAAEEANPGLQPVQAYQQVFDRIVITDESGSRIEIRESPPGLPQPYFALEDDTELTFEQSTSFRQWSGGAIAVVLLVIIFGWIAALVSGFLGLVLIRKARKISSK